MGPGFTQCDPLLAVIRHKISHQGLKAVAVMRMKGVA
jgi:hypothetical protein